jgi:hypothetical protein
MLIRTILAVITISSARAKAYDLEVTALPDAIVLVGSYAVESTG